MAEDEAAVGAADGAPDEEGAASGRIVDALRDDSADEGEGSLRPSRLDEFVGQETVLNALRIAIEAASRRGEPLDHLLLYGPPGLGKTTLARIVARELGVALRTTSGPAIQRQGDLASILSTLDARDVLFIDEIHRLPTSVEEVLYSSMEEFEIDIVIGAGPSARSMRYPLKPFTLIGATTRYAMLSSPLRDRFGIIERLDFYSAAELRQVVGRSAEALGVALRADARDTIAARSRGTPRIANRLLKRVRDYAEVKSDGTVTPRLAAEALAMLGISENGLDDRDRALLRALIEHAAEGPIGLNNLAAAIAEEPDTVMDVYEPFLLQQGFLARTARGRVPLAKAWRQLGLEPPRADEDQPTLFGGGPPGG